jgi:hypothetical protein
MTGFIILVVLILLAVWVYTVVAKIPGETARERGHPQSEAINVLGWVGLLFGAVPWVVALVWAYTKPSAAAPSTSGLAGVDPTDTDQKENSE